MLRLSLIACLAPAALLSASCAPMPGDTAMADGGMSRPERQCFLPQQVNNFRNDRETTTYIRAGRAGVFQLDGAFCRDLDRANAIVIQPQMGGGRLCVGDTAEIRYRASGGEADSCRVTVGAHLDDAAIAALPGSVRP